MRQLLNANLCLVEFYQIHQNNAPLLVVPLYMVLAKIFGNRLFLVQIRLKQKIFFF